jgi:lysophospholipase L1-like esterase
MASKQRPLISVLFLSNIRKLINIDVYDDINVITNINVDLFPLFTETLSKARDMTKAYNGKLYFVYLPEYKRYSNDMVNHNQHRMKSKIMKIVKELNIPTIDIHQEVFSEHPDPLSLFPLRMSGHYNVDGYTEVAKAIVKGVKEYEKAQ